MTADPLQAFTSQIQEALSANRLILCFYSTFSEMDVVCSAPDFPLRKPESCTLESFALQVTVPEHVPHLHFMFTHETPLELFCWQLGVHLRWLRHNWGTNNPRALFLRPVVWLHESAVLLLSRLKWSIDLDGALAMHVQQGGCAPAEQYFYVPDKSLGRPPSFPTELWNAALVALDKRLLAQNLPDLTRGYVASRQRALLTQRDPLHEAHLWLTAFQAFEKWNRQSSHPNRRLWRSVVRQATQVNLFALEHADEVIEQVYQGHLQRSGLRDAIGFVASVMDQASINRQSAFLPLYFDLFDWASRHLQAQETTLSKEHASETVDFDFLPEFLDLFVKATHGLEESTLLTQPRLWKAGLSWQRPETPRGSKWISPKKSMAFKASKWLC